jgi:hypothetical protein
MMPMMAAFASSVPSRPMILFDHHSIITICIMVLHYSGFNNQSYAFLTFQHWSCQSLHIRIWPKMLDLSQFFSSLDMCLHASII